MACSSKYCSDSDEREVNTAVILYDPCSHHVVKSLLFHVNSFSDTIIFFVTVYTHIHKYNKKECMLVILVNSNYIYVLYFDSAEQK